MTRSLRRVLLPTRHSDPRVMQVAKVSDLTPSDQMTYWIGAAAQHDVELEHELAGINARLSGQTRAPARTSVDSLSKALRRTVNSDRFDNDPLRAPVLTLLDEIDREHNERNRLVHDLWASDLDAPEAFERLLLRGQPEKGPGRRQLDDFKRCAEALRLLGFRVTALAFILADRETPDFWPESSTRPWWEALAGNVALSEGGGFSITSEPEP